MAKSSNMSRGLRLRKLKRLSGLSHSSLEKDLDNAMMDFTVSNRQQRLIERFNVDFNSYICWNAENDFQEEKLSCMPSYKGVTGLGKKVMSEKTKQKLREFYSASFDRFSKFYSNKLSWMWSQIIYSELEDERE